MNYKTFSPVFSRTRWQQTFRVAAILCCLTLSLLFSQDLSAQEGPLVTVRGVVTNQRGEPLAGVTVSAAGKTSLTNNDGSFEMHVSAGTSVNFSYTGYVDYKLTARKNQTIFKIELQSKQDLDEVVVVGYGTRRKSEVTSSMVSVSEQSIKDIPTANLASAIQGRAAGIDIKKINGNSKPGAEVSILIRGSRSLEAGNQPLIVVDGIPFSGSFNDINQGDVSSVEVLKDASATAIYGSRGANGVILISTRRGKSGKPVISYNGYGGFSDRIGKYDLMNAQEFIEFKKWAYYNGRWKDGKRQYASPEDPLILENEFSKEELDIMKTGGTVDWQDLVYKRGIITDHQLGVTGGTDQTQYAVSGSYFNQTGVYPGQSFERFSLKVSVDQQLTKIFKVGISTLNTFGTIKGESINPMSQALRASPMVSPWDESGVLRNDFVPGSASQVWNPLADFISGAKQERRKRTNSFNTLYLDANLGFLLKGLKYRFNAGAELYNEVYGFFRASKTTDNMGGPSTSRNRTVQRTNFTLEHILNYDRTFAEKHKIQFTGLFSVQQQKGQDNEFNNNDILADALEYFNPVYASNLTGRGNFSNWGLISYMGRLNYNYDERYMLTATVRTDGSSRLAKGNQFQTFPSAAVAWNIHNEDFFNVKAISNLRLRASYGRVGNASINPYQTRARLGPFPMNFGEVTTTGVYLTGVKNDNLVWEYTTTAELGLDFGLFSNRVSGSIGVYKQITSNLLFAMTLPHTSGIQNTPVTNVGETENKGIEIQISTQNVIAKSRNDFSWGTDINFFINRGKINKLRDGVNSVPGNGWFVGQPIGVIYDRVRDGIWQATKDDSALAVKYKQSLTESGSVIGTIKTIDVNNDGKMDDNDRTIIGSLQPKWQGGITNRFGWRGFDLTIVAFARMGGLFRSTLHGGGFANTYQGTYNNIKTRFWTPDNFENEFPKPNADRTQTQLNGLMGIFDASFLKIRTISLGYTLSPALVKRVGAKNIKVYATVSDPFIFFSPFRNHPFGGLDPETGGDQENPTKDAQLSIDTPPSWSMIFGLNISF